MKIAKRQITPAQFDAARHSSYSARSDRQNVYESTAKFQQAFKSWFRVARHRIAIPLTIRQKSSRCIRLSFDQYPTELAVWIQPGDISVAVAWKGRCIDLLTSIDMVIPVYCHGKHGEQVIVCGACTDEDRAQYATLKQLWVEHLFEEFAEWVNETLAPAAWLSMHEVVGGGGTWARLHMELPLQEDSTLCILRLPLDAGSLSPVPASRT